MDVKEWSTWLIALEGYTWDMCDEILSDFSQSTF